MAHPRIGLENLTVLGARPTEAIAIAAGLGCGFVSLYIDTIPRPDGIEPHSLLRDSVRRRETLFAAAGFGVEIALLDGVAIEADKPAAELRAVFEVAAELGVPRVNIVSRDPDWARTVDGMATAAGLAQEYGVTLLTEPCPFLPVPSLEVALRLIGEVGVPGLSVLVDTMHLGRWGTTPRELAEADPSLIGYIQLCDGPTGIGTSAADYLRGAVRQRMVPGEGDLPLAEYLAILPAGVPVSVEVPQAGLLPAERAERAIRGAEQVLAKAATLRPILSPIPSGETA